MSSIDAFLKNVSRSLKRDSAPTTIPAPPALADRIIRLQPTSGDLAQAFVANATASKLHVLTVDPTGLADAMVEFLRSHQLPRVMLTRCAMFEKLNLIGRLRESGLDANYWDQMTLDAGYEVDVGLTDVYAAVAETGSLVVKESAGHGRAVSLVPPVHVAVVERSQIVPDLVDLMEKLSADGTGSGVVIITGPSKTADIEMNLVVGVHGPGEVQVFLV
jgi:L-lactate dehydrogenase complex protein LldG